MTEFEKVRAEIVRFLRGKYRLNEVPDTYQGIPCLKFRQGTKTIVSISLRPDHYVFQIVLGKAEREKFEAARDGFPATIQALYDQTHTYHDGKWLFIRVDDLQTLEAVKKLILIKKKPNRKPLSKENAVYGKCGHRCDMCPHYTQNTDALRESLIPHLIAVYDETDWSMRCTGCDTAGCHCCGEGEELCKPLECLREKRLDNCFACADYPCEHATVGYRALEPRALTADDVTWAILPYVPDQYED